MPARFPLFPLAIACVGSAVSVNAVLAPFDADLASPSAARVESAAAPQQARVS